ncbi:MAG: hypothetical protein ACRCS8_02095 [Brevinema sp.]
MWHNLSQQQFYKGQSVSPEHLNQMQEYTDHTQCQTINSVFGKGVLYGFEVSHTADQIIISKGMGFDDRGRKLLLHEDKIIPLNEINISKHSLLKLGVQFCVIESDPIQDVTGTIINTKLTPSVEFVLGEELDAEILFLADIEITATEILSVKQKINFLPNYLNFAEKIINIAYPIQSIYTQYPKFITNSEGEEIYLGFVQGETPAMLFGGVWELQDINISMSPKIYTANDGSVVTKWADGRMEIEIPQNLLANTTYTYPEKFLQVPLFNGLLYNRVDLLYVLSTPVNDTRSLEQVTESSFRYVSSLSSTYGAPSGFLIGYWKEYKPQNNAKVWKRVA